jgi:hypothetical protein
MSVYPENPPGQAFVSQDTYASPGVALSGLGGGSAGPNLEVSTLTVNGSGIITLNTFPSAQTQSASIFFKSSGADTVESGILEVRKQPIQDINMSSIAGLSVSAFSTFGSYQPLGVGDLYLGDSANDGSYGTAALKYTNATSTLRLEAPSVEISTLVGVQTINGQGVAAFTGSIPADLAVSTLNVNSGVFINGSSIQGISSINGAAYSGGGSAGPNLTVSTLTVNPDINIGSLTSPNIQITSNGFLTLGSNPDNVLASNPILFNRAGFSTIATGQVSLQMIGGTLIAGTISTGFSSTVPVVCASLILGGDDPTAEASFTNIHYSSFTSTLSVQAPNVSISSLLGVSSINGVNWDFITSTLAG